MTAARFAPSVFDRLLDDAPERAADDAATATERLRQQREALRRDLETLFNTPSTLHATNPGVLGYGIVGFHGLDLATTERRRALAKALREAIARHEPRLHDVRVEIAGDHAEARSLRLRVTATVHFEDHDEPVAFDTVLDPALRQFHVRRGAE